MVFRLYDLFSKLLQRRCSINILHGVYAKRMPKIFCPFFSCFCSHIHLAWVCVNGCKSSGKFTFVEQVGRKFSLPLTLRINVLRFLLPFNFYRLFSSPHMLSIVSIATHWTYGAWAFPFSNIQNENHIILREKTKRYVSWAQWT